MGHAFDLQYLSGWSQGSVQRVIEYSQGTEAWFENVWWWWWWWWFLLLLLLLLLFCPFSILPSIFVFVFSFYFFPLLSFLEFFLFVVRPKCIFLFFSCLVIFSSSRVLFCVLCVWEALDCVKYKLGQFELYLTF